MILAVVILASSILATITLASSRFATIALTSAMLAVAILAVLILASILTVKFSKTPFSPIRSVTSISSATTLSTSRSPLIKTSPSITSGSPGAAGGRSSMKGPLIGSPTTTLSKPIIWLAPIAELAQISP